MMIHCDRGRLLRATACHGASVHFPQELAILKAEVLKLHYFASEPSPNPSILRLGALSVDSPSPKIIDVLGSRIKR